MVRSTVDTGPTKNFFIRMITRDISLTDAIIELLDNSLDAAKKKNAQNDYSGYKIEINFSKDFFSIKDNCGGISIKDAKEYVFYFGRPSTKDVSNNDVELTGVFGIGMKRALFKMGEGFQMESVTENSKFTIDLDVVKWSEDLINWNFPIEEEEGKQDTNDIGTEITVKDLYEGISTDFDSTVFENELRNKIQQRASFEIENKLSIIVNEIPIAPLYMEIINSEDIKPIKKAFSLSDVNVVIIAGIANTTSKDNAGWYIYCNNRLIISADQTSLTTWNYSDTVKFHSDFALFRGFVFFNCKNPEKLPWNTSKTGIDTSSKIYISTKLIMIDIFKVITAELRNMKKIDKEEAGSIEKELEQKQSLPVSVKNISTQISENNLFSITEKIKAQPNPNPVQRITYYKYKREIDIAKKALGATRLHEVGEKTFEYYFEMECE